MRKKEFDMEKTSRRRLGVVLSTLAMTAVILAGAAAGFIIFTLATGPDLSLMDAAPDGYRTTVVPSCFTSSSTSCRKPSSETAPLQSWRSSSAAA